MSIHLYQNQKYQTKGYSTNAVDRSEVNSSRSFQKYRRQESGQFQRPKAFNMNDEQRRIKRQHASLYKQSTQQSALFEKGVKKIQKSVQQNAQTKRQESIKRTYHNKETYNVINPKPITQTKFNQGGVKKIYLYDQRKQSNPFRNNSQSRKKLIKDHNKQTQASNDAGVFLIKKLPTHKNAATQWHNSVTSLHFNKKQNINSKQNRKNIDLQEPTKKNFKQLTMNIKNQSHFTVKQNGITLNQSKKSNQAQAQDIDFTQRYYQKYTRLDKPMAKHSQSGYLSYRQK